MSYRAVAASDQVCSDTTSKEPLSPESPRFSSFTTCETLSSANEAGDAGETLSSVDGTGAGGEAFSSVDGAGAGVETLSSVCGTCACGSALSSVDETGAAPSMTRDCGGGVLRFRPGKQRRRAQLQLPRWGQRGHRRWCLRCCLRHGRWPHYRRLGRRP